MEKVVGACGLICSECATYIATFKDDNEFREKTAKRMREQYKISMNSEDINCQGCMAPGPHIGYCAVCKIRDCIVEKKLENCAYCDDYPCDVVEKFHKMAPKAKENIEIMRADLKKSK